MDKILGRIEQMVEKMLADLEAKPIKTSIKLFIFFWIAKTVWKEIKR
jgi:hypothetical protein